MKVKIFLFSIILLSCLFVIPVLANTLEVSKVLDGPIVQFGNFKVWIKGVCTKDLGDEAIAKVSTFTREKLVGKIIKAFTYTTDGNASGIVYDENGIAYMKILCGEKMDRDFAAMLIEKGMVKVDDRYLDDEEKKLYNELMEKAKAAKIGIWCDKQ